MQRQDLWPTPLWYFEVPQTQINPQAIARESYAHQKLDAGVSYSNVGGYQSSALTLDDPMPPELTKLLGVLTKECQTCSREFGFERNLEIANYWVNINKHNNYNKMHIHPSSILSGTYYAVTPPQSGSIVFHNRPEASYILAELKLIGARNTSFTSTVQSFEPKAGAVLVFPGWLQHSVEENRSGGDRISIAFNLT